MSSLALLRGIGYHSWTVYLFTKADIKTTFLPIFVFALAAAPVQSLSRVPHAAFWLWLHLLHFDVANQVLGVEEDARNKADRPLPAGRISLRNAVIFRWALIPICFAVSLAYSAQVLYASVVFAGLTLLYNELHADAAYWAVRNSVNGAGFAAFEWGTTLVLGRDASKIDAVAVLAIAHSACILATTIQVQDFKDVVGDRHVGRKTFPIVAERVARLSVIGTLLAWSVGLSVVWALDAVTMSVFVSLAVLIGVRFLRYRTIPEDKTSYQIYNVWLSFAHVLPGYWRLATAIRG